jgi:hypothetical protein
VAAHCLALHQTISQPYFHVNKVNMDNEGLKRAVPAIFQRRER